MASALTATTGTASHLGEIRSRRPVAAADLALAGVALAAAATTWLTAALLDVPGEWAGATRNCLGYLGIAYLAARAVDATAGAVAPLLAALIVAVLGSPLAGLWSWPLWPADSPMSWGAALMLLSAGLVARAQAKPPPA